MDKEEIFHKKRAILFTTRIRFSPEVQPVKQTAIDKILEQNLLFFDKNMTIDELRREGIVCFKYDFDIITRQDMQESLDRLASKGRITVQKGDHENLYKLAENIRKELEREQEDADRLFEKVVNRVFKNVEGYPSIFREPFLKCLSLIFSELAEYYVKVLKAEVTEEEFIGSSALSSSIDQVEKEFSHIIEGSSFRDGVIDFFRFTDPDYDTIKWNMAQNYYIAKVLGMDPEGVLLSREIFGGAIFYLDTNVIVSALEPKDKHHRSFKELSAACKKISIELNACQITLNELHGSVDYQRQLIEKVADRIPEETKPKIRGIFYELYREKQLSDGEVDFNTLFSSFEDPMKKLKESFGVQLVDDKWFDSAEKEKTTLDLVNFLKRKYMKMRGRPKSKPIALHDALLLLWLQKARKEGKINTWLITLDTTLPGSLAQTEKEKGRPYAITLDALLQWISPIGITYETEADFATVFSEAVKYQLLPRDRFFDMKDFLIFAELQIETKELPAVDVEQSIRHIRTHAPGLDPSDPNDREKLARELAKFFVDPGRKYKQDVSRLESKVSKLESKLTKIDQVLNQRDEKIEQLEEKIKEETRAKQEESLKRSGQIRLLITFLLFCLFELSMTYIANLFASGQNLAQKVINFWPFFVAGFPLFYFLGAWILGKERIIAIGYPFKTIFKAE
jgi:predicted transcriptional regulator